MKLKLKPFFLSVKLPYFSVFRKGYDITTNCFIWGHWYPVFALSATGNKACGVSKIRLFGNIWAMWARTT